jgi:manganese efflux pump family protein
VLAEIIILAAVGLDKLAVCIGFGMAGIPKSRWVRIGLIFMAYAVLMLGIGLLAGESLSGRAAAVVGYISAFALIGLGAVGITHALQTASEELPPDEAPAQVGTSVNMTAFLISLDCLAVGIPLGLRHVPIGPTLLYFAAQSFAAAIVGLWLGSRLGTRLGGRAEIASVVLLTGIGFLLLLSQLFDIKLIKPA